MMSENVKGVIQPIRDTGGAMENVRHTPQRDSADATPGSVRYAARSKLFGHSAGLSEESVLDRAAWYASLDVTFRVEINQSAIVLSPRSIGFCFGGGYEGIWLVLGFTRFHRVLAVSVIHGRSLFLKRY
jgi:hypothetical protein